jgi:hypothetical protein
VLPAKILNATFSRFVMTELITFAGNISDEVTGAVGGNVGSGVGNVDCICWRAAVAAVNNVSLTEGRSQQ